jgi:hypothetical protein
MGNSNATEDPNIIKEAKIGADEFMPKPQDIFEPTDQFAWVIDGSEVPHGEDPQ